MTFRKTNKASNDSNASPLSENDAKRLGKLAKWLLALSALVLLINLPIQIKERFAPSLPFENVQNLKAPERYTKHIRLNNQDMRIPVGFFYTPPEPGVEQDGALLVTLFPDFRPLTESPQKLWEKGEWGRKVLVLIEAPQQRLRQNEYLAKLMEINFATRHVGRLYGLEHYKHPEDKRYDRKEILVNGGVASPNGFIACTPPEQSQNPQCSHYFWTYNLFFEVSYDRTLLAEWHEIQKLVEQLVKQFHQAFLDSNRTTFLTQ